MAEEGKPQETPASAARSRDDILGDPLIVNAVVPVRDAILDVREAIGEVTLVVEREKIREVCSAFKADGFTYLVDLCGVDYSAYPGHTGGRFAVAYMLYSFERNERIRLKVLVPEGVPVPSVTPVWKTANWHEREVWDMYGIPFEGHPNLERILMWEGFNGHPLRKDFPIRGIDTGASIYPEIFPAGTGPMPGSTGKNVDDVNIYRGEWTKYGTAPVVQPAEEPKKVIAAPAAEEAALATEPAAAAAKFHDENLTLAQRMDLAKDGDLKTKLFAAMAQTDCEACGWDCEGYAEAIAKGETTDLTLCVPGEAETEEMLMSLMKGAKRP